MPCCARFPVTWDDARIRSKQTTIQVSISVNVLGAKDNWHRFCSFYMQKVMMHVMCNKFTTAAYSDDGDEDLGAGVRVLRTCSFL